MTALGYTVQSETSNTVVAEQRVGGGIHTTLTAATFDDQLRVTTDMVNRYGQGQTQQLGSTSHSRADAQAVLDACGRR